MFGAGAGSYHEGVAEMKHWRLTTTPIPHFSALRGAEGWGREEEDIEEGKWWKGGSQ